MEQDIVARCLAEPPLDKRHVAGRWHHGRIDWRGFAMEARVHAAVAFKPKNNDVGKFLIICRARSGSTLATQLLNAHPDITCDREILARNVVSAHRLLESLALKATTPVYGCKLLSYQMVHVHRFKKPAAFLEKVIGSGHKLLHIERDTFSQTLSLYMAQSRGLYHVADESKKSAGWSKDTLTSKSTAMIDVDRFVALLKWQDMLSQYEKHVLKDVPHKKIRYDTDLAGAQAQKETANALYEWLGVVPFDPPIKMKKVLAQDPKDTIENYDALSKALKTHGLAHFLSS